MIVVNESVFIQNVEDALGAFVGHTVTFANNELTVNEVQAGDRSSGTALTSEQQTTVASVYAAHNSLALQASAGTITANDSDTSIITCLDAVIVGDSDLDYEVYGSNGSLDFSGTVAVVAGTATFNFSTAVADTYTIRFSRQGASDYEDGYVTVEAQ